MEAPIEPQVEVRILKSTPKRSKPTSREAEDETVQHPQLAATLEKGARNVAFEGDDALGGEDTLGGERDLPSRQTPKRRPREDRAAGVGVGAGEAEDEGQRRPHTKSAASRKSVTREEADLADGATAEMQYQDARQKQKERDLLRAMRYGDVRRMTSLLSGEGTLNIDHVEDSRGQSLLMVAVKQDQLEMVESLLPRSHPLNVYRGLIVSIGLDRHHITEIIIRHPKYEEVRRHMTPGRVAAVSSIADESEFTLPADESQLSGDVTPLSLAATRNQFEIVKLLLSLGDKIDEPHDNDCSCEECRGSPHYDEYRNAKTRLSFYRAMASDAYLTLSSSDPILRGFQLARKLRKLSNIESHFKSEFAEIATQASGVVVRLLDKVRDGEELDVLLDQTDGNDLGDSYDKMARLKLAIHYKEKRFAAHASCQKKLSTLWNGELPNIERPAVMLLFLILLPIAYPFLAILYWVYPWGKIGAILRSPIVKFWASALSYIAFIIMLTVFSATEAASAGYTLSQHATVGPLYLDYVTNMTSQPLVQDVWIRYSSFSTGTIVVCVWLVGLLWHNIKKLYTERFMYFTENWYNSMDFCMLILYITSFTMRFVTMDRVWNSLDYFSSRTNWIRLAGDIPGQEDAVANLYWLNADRDTWDPYDPLVLAEALFAIANLISVIRLTYLFMMSERLGPLVLSLTKMILDMFFFMFLFVFIMAAFVIGFHNLYWYFYPGSLGGTGGNVDNLQAYSTFGGVAAIIQTCFWTIFGMIDLEFDMFDTFENQRVTAITGHVMFALYNWMMLIILINMLIAMMTRSYEFIAEEEDSEWKFARTKLYLEFIKEGCTLCVPFNLVPTWKSVYLAMRAMCRMCGCCGGSGKAAKKPDPREKDANGGFQYYNTPQLLAGARGSGTLRAQSSLVGHDVLMLKTLATMNMADLDQHIDEKTAKKKQDSEKYQEVIKNIVDRFIQQGGKGKNGAEDGGDGLAEQVKSDLSSLKREVTMNMMRQQKDQQLLMERLSALDGDLAAARGALEGRCLDFSTDQQENMAELRAELKYSQSSLGGFQSTTVASLESVHSDLTSLAARFESVSRHSQEDTGTNMEIMKDALWRLCADVTSLRRVGIAPIIAQPSLDTSPHYGMSADMTSQSVEREEMRPAYVRLGERRSYRQAAVSDPGDLASGHVSGSSPARRAPRAHALLAQSAAPHTPSGPPAYSSSTSVHRDAPGSGQSIAIQTDDPDRM